MSKKILCTILIGIILFSNIIPVYATITEEYIENDIEEKEINDVDKEELDNVDNESENSNNIDENEIYSDNEEDKIQDDVIDESNEKEEQKNENEENLLPDDIFTSNEEMNAVNAISPDLTKLVEIDGVWRMIVNGKIIYDYTGVGQNDNGMWYLENGEITYKYTDTYYENDNAYIIEGNRVQAILPKDTTKLMEINNIWRMVVKGKIIYDYTGLGQNDNGMWYLENGEITYKYTDTYYENDNAYIIEGNRVQAILPKDTTKLMEINNIWRMVVKGKIIYDYTGLGKNDNGTYYIEKGDISYKYNGLYKDSTGDYVIEKSKVVTGTKLIEIDNTWRMVVNGKIVYDYTGVGQNGNGMWYLENGEITYKYTDTYYENDKAYIIEKNRVQVIVSKDTTKLMEINNNWRMVVNGKIIYDYTGLGKNDNGTYYIEKGNISYNYNGIYKDINGEHVIEKSKVVTGTKLMEINHTWRMVVNGKIVYDYTGVGQNGNGMWYLENGEITYKYTDTYYENDNAYIIEGNRVQAILPKDTTKLMEINNIWRMVVKGKIIYDYTGLGKNDNGMYYLEKGDISYKYNGTAKDDTGTYVVENSKVITATRLMEIDNIWRMVVNGKIVYDYTGVGQNGNGMWYLENGEITYKYTATYFKDNTAYIIEGNRVYKILPLNVTQLIEINKEWRMVINSEVDYNYTGAAEKDNGEKWYLENGKITYKYTAEYTYTDGVKYLIVNSRFRDVLSTPGYPGTISVDQPKEAVGYISDALSISGWALTEERNDSILIYVDGKYLGKATREANAEAFNKYPNNEYGGKDANPYPGFYYNLASAKLSVGKHDVKIVNMASDGKTIIQSREVKINITALTKSYGIDVSNWQGMIDWEAVKNSGVTFAILKIGEYHHSTGSIYKDKQFERNYAECKRLGIAVGGYFYSYAFDSKEAAIEAESCLQIIKGKRFELPIFYDVEDNTIVQAIRNWVTNPEILTNASITFCNMLNNAGYEAGVYTYRHFFQDYLNVSALERYSIWLADYIKETPYKGKYDFWQYTSSGSVPGIEGNVDLNWHFPKK